MLGLLGVMREVVGGVKISVLLPGTDRVIEGSSGGEIPNIKDKCYHLCCQVL